VVFVFRGFDDLLVPLRDVSAQDVPATTAAHTVVVFCSFCQACIAMHEVFLKMF